MSEITGGVSLGQDLPVFPEMEMPDFATPALEKRWRALRNRQRDNFNRQQQLLREHNITLDVQQMILSYLRSVVTVLTGDPDTAEAQDKKLQIEESFETETSTMLKLALDSAVQIKLRMGTATPGMMEQLAKQSPGLVKRPGG